MATPAIVRVDAAIKSTGWDTHTADERGRVVCPCCGCEQQSVGEPRSVASDNYSAWEGRGGLDVIPFSGECGSEWELCFGFHKGDTAAYVRVTKDCHDTREESL